MVTLRVVTGTEVNLGILTVGHFRIVVNNKTWVPDELLPQAPESHIQPLTESFPFVVSILTWPKPSSQTWAKGRMLVHRWWV